MSVTVDVNGLGKAHAEAIERLLGIPVTRTRRVGRQETAEAATRSAPGLPPRWEPHNEDHRIATVGDVEVWLVEYPVSAGVRVAVRDTLTGDAVVVDSRVALVVVEALRTAAVLGGAR